MRQINLAGKFYEIKDDIVQRAINPWIAKVGSGGVTYENFSNANLEEYHDFRNGIGLKRGVGSDARLDFSEGIDFTIEGQAVLDPLVTTAGAFGVAPVKIIDFQDKTYAIGNDVIKVWNTSTLAWDYLTSQIENCEDVWDAYQNPNATIAIDGTDKQEGTNSLKITVNSPIVGEMLAIEAITFNLTEWLNVKLWIKSQLATALGDLQLHLLTWTDPTGNIDNGWTNPTYAYDNNEATAATWNFSAPGNWSPFLELTHSGQSSNIIRVLVDNTTSGENSIDIDAYYGGAWHDIHQGNLTNTKTWFIKKIPDGTQTITSIRVRCYGVDGAASIYEVDYGLANLIDIPALTADTWTEVTKDFDTPTNLGSVTQIGLWSATDLGAEPYIIRVDDVKGIPYLTSLIDAIVVTDATDEYLVVSTPTGAFYWDGGTIWLPLTTVMGYLAFYATKLYGITTTGNILYYSAANSINGSSRR